MARLEDYLPKTDELEDEITNAVVQTAERQETAKSTIPERFQGKSAEDIAGSYTELEKLNSRQAQDLGEMRKQVDTLMRQSLEQANATPPEEVKPVTVDDLYEDPESAIERVIERKLRPQLEAQENALRGANTDRKMSEMDDQYEGWREAVTTDDFTDFISKSAYRQRMSEAVRNDGDLDAASDLLEQYYEQNDVKVKRDKRSEKRAKDLSNATLTTGGAEYSEPQETMSRKELMNVRIRAKQGDRKADQWLKENHHSITSAYAEGRIVD